MVIVSDTSPISNLIQIRRLDILKHLFNELIVPPYVDSEIRALEQFGYDLSSYKDVNWIKIQSPQNQELTQELEQELDKGESEAIALSKELEPNLLLIDERSGTQIAKKMGIKTIGLLGCLIMAKEKDIIVEIKSILDDLEIIAGFYMGEKLKSTILKIVNE